MSEYQHVAFRAIDKPVSNENLKFMRQQSTRAEITSRTFDNEYHYGDFNGDALEMMRRGYDLHLHYANFGIRKLMFRLPRGLPDCNAAKPYLDEDGIQFKRDKSGSAGTLTIEPYFEAGELEEFWEFDDLLDHLIGIREELQAGDLRPLYLAHLAVSRDGNHDPERSTESPVPAGLDQCSDAQLAFAEFLGVDQHLIAAAAQGCLPLPPKTKADGDFMNWLRTQSQSNKDRWLAEWLADPQTDARDEMLSEYRKRHNSQLWPTIRLGRTLAELQTRADEIEKGAKQRAAAKAARQREKRLADMAADPAATLRKTETLVGRRGTEGYREAAELLAELRDALVGTPRSGLAEEQARKLTSANPTLRMLTSELRKKGFVPK